MSEPNSFETILRPSNKSNIGNANTTRVLFRLFAIIACLGLIGYLDYVTGYELPLFALYVIPIAMTVWFFGPFLGAIVAVASIILWGWIDIVGGHEYSTSWMFYLAAVNRLFFFAITVIGLRYVKSNFELHQRLRRAFIGEMSICSHCDKILGPDGRWTSFENYIRENTDAVIKHKVCGDCHH